MLSIKSECLNRMIFFGERRLRDAIASYLAHYRSERPHQGIGNQRIEAGLDGSGHVRVRERLGGLLMHYYRAA